MSLDLNGTLGNLIKNAFPHPEVAAQQVILATAIASAVTAYVAAYVKPLEDALAALGKSVSHPDTSPPSTADSTATSGTAAGGNTPGGERGTESTNSKHQIFLNNPSP